MYVGKIRKKLRCKLLWNAGWMLHCVFQTPSNWRSCCNNKWMFRPSSGLSEIFSGARPQVRCLSVSTLYVDTCLSWEMLVFLFLEAKMFYISLWWHNNFRMFRARDFLGWWKLYVLWSTYWGWQNWEFSHLRKGALVLHLRSFRDLRDRLPPLLSKSCAVFMELLWMSLATSGIGSSAAACWLQCIRAAVGMTCNTLPRWFKIETLTGDWSFWNLPLTITNV